VAAGTPIDNEDDEPEQFEPQRLRELGPDEHVAHEVHHMEAERFEHNIRAHRLSTPSSERRASTLSAYTDGRLAAIAK
jgi:hypothetical protein